ncbi:flippase-like domain-containing protein [Candidatus Woesearchaeota archaeon]|nr:flippase-like domain-containing protein [Candidatus Woesearchaeota archaeon]
MISKNFIQRIILAAAILTILTYTLGIRKLFETLLSANLLWVVPTILLWILLFLLGAYNLKILLNALGVKMPLLKLFRYNLMSWASGLILPGKIGEFILIKFLKKDNVEYGLSSVLYLIDKAITLIFLIVASTIGAIFLFDTDYLTLPLMVLSFLLFIFIVAMISEKVKAIIKKYILRKYSTMFSGFSSNLLKLIKHKKSAILFNLTITILKAMISSVAVSFLFLSFGQQVNFLHILVIDSMITILTFIPITPNGLGIKESSAALFYTFIGLDPVITASAYILGTIVVNLIVFFTFLALRVRI